MTGKAKTWAWCLGTVAVVLGATVVYQKSFEVFSDAHAAVAPSNETAPLQAFPTQVMGGITTPSVATDTVDAKGRPVALACSNCHAVREPNRHTASGTDLDTFHQGLSYQHGGLTCLSCHHSENYDRLRLADGTQLAYERSMDLCAQCHGPQHRDYQAGSHGGMTGYWDLNQGPRERNHCLVCHDPHFPSYPPMMPVFPPKDAGHPKTSHATHSNH